ncbi:uncharacterized protein LOC108199907 isoform X5 [Daucus carota subsp. sativus]|uniref:uncharacterized protein LOC108199907 isoform X5 n=1 Tax=Daucus carota subsp. sativus TaxID=79200 RepID=UPI0030826D86
MNYVKSGKSGCASLAFDCIESGGVVPCTFVGIKRIYLVLYWKSDRECAERSERMEANKQQLHNQRRGCCRSYVLVTEGGCRNSNMHQSTKEAFKNSGLNGRDVTPFTRLIVVWLTTKLVRRSVTREKACFRFQTRLSNRDCSI